MHSITLAGQHGAGLLTSFILSKRINLLKYLSKEIEPSKLAKVLTQTKTQIEKLLDFKLKVGESGKNAKCFLNSMVFFVTDTQKEKIEKAISLLYEQVKDEKTKAAKNAVALTLLAEYYLDRNKN